MPRCGSQIILCDVPIRFDTYEGCGHACSYCFVSRKANIAKIKGGESATQLRAFIDGRRNYETSWCDWDIPLHWGGMSDPFQPIERKERRSLEALKVFAETKYPFIVSTKNALIAEEPYLSLIKQCNCVVQFSIASPKYNEIERGASTYEQRLEAARKIAPYRRVVFRVQPYIPAIFRDVITGCKTFAGIGVHGLILEGMKYTKNAVAGLIAKGADYVYPVDTLLPQFSAIKGTCHKYGMKFYSGENRLRGLGDELCCCGIEGLGWKPNTANLNHLLFAPETYKETPKMKEAGGGKVFKAMEQDTLSNINLKKATFSEKMLEYARNPYPFTEGGGYGFSKEQEDTLRQYLRSNLKASGHTAAEVDKHMGNYMARHYFGFSQWSFPTEEQYAKLRGILPNLGDYAEVLASVGVRYQAPTLYKF